MGIKDGNIILKNMLKKNGLSLVPHPKYGYGYPLLFIDELMLHCVPREINGNQLIKIVEKYTENNPKVWHKNIIMIMEESIKDAQLEKCDVENYYEDVLRDKGFIK